VFTLFTFAICVINFNSLIGDQLDRDSSPLFTPGDTLISKPKIWPEPAQWFWVAKVLRLSCSHSSRELSHRKICMTVMSEKRKLWIWPEILLHSENCVCLPTRLQKLWCISVARGFASCPGERDLGRGSLRCRVCQSSPDILANITKNNWIFFLGHLEYHPCSAE
jgi:hypothetical protein